MQSYLLAAGVLMILIGVANSVIGEILIFRQLRAGTIVPLLAPHHCANGTCESSGRTGTCARCWDGGWRRC